MNAPDDTYLGTLFGKYCTKFNKARRKRVGFLTQINQMGLLEERGEPREEEKDK